MIVVDTNIVTYLLIDGAHTAQAEKALQKDGSWAAPVLWKSEFRNVLSVYIRRQYLELDQAVKLMNEAEYLLNDNQYHVSSLEVLKLALVSGCSAYDCEFVALAKDLGIPLITLDKKILKAFPNFSIALDHFIQ